jgi:hypothetical protein
VKPARKYRIAYLAECISNPYCETRLKGVQAALHHIFVNASFQVVGAE